MYAKYYTDRAQNGYVHMHRWDENNTGRQQTAEQEETHKGHRVAEREPTTQSARFSHAAWSSEDHNNNTSTVRSFGPNCIVFALHMYAAPSVWSVLPVVTPARSPGAGGDPRRGEDAGVGVSDNMRCSLFPRARSNYVPVQ